jgi:hypothetical protein
LVLLFKYLLHKDYSHVLSFSPNVHLLFKTRDATHGVLDSHGGGNPLGLSVAMSHMPRSSVSSTSWGRKFTSFQSPLIARRYATMIHQKKDNYEDEDEEIDISDKDWRAFRAQLVMQDSMPSSVSSSSSSKGRSEEEEKEAATAAEAEANVNAPSISSATNNINQEDLDGIGSLFTTPQEPTPMT